MLIIVSPPTNYSQYRFTLHSATELAPSVCCQSHAAPLTPSRKALSEHISLTPAIMAAEPKKEEKKASGTSTPDSSSEEDDDTSSEGSDDTQKRLVSVN